MARSAAALEMQRKAQSAQLGISEDEYQHRLDAIRDPSFVNKAYGGAGMTVSPDVIAARGGGKSYADIYGKDYEFLDRGGLGARGSAAGGYQPTQQFHPETAPRRSGFASAPGAQAPGFQPPQAPAGPGGMSAPAPAPVGGMQGFAGVKPRQPPGGSPMGSRPVPGRGLGYAAWGGQR